MSEGWAYGGAALLAAATLPQAWRLARTRRAEDLGWSFLGLNATGIVLLALRSAELGEAPFVAANVLTAGFWGFAALVKALPYIEMLPLRKSLFARSALIK
jgi:hypothetical protein